jgi:hypothetical protein
MTRSRAGVAAAVATGAEVITEVPPTSAAEPFTVDVTALPAEDTDIARYPDAR